MRHSLESEVMTPLSRQLSLQAQAYRSLRSAILSGELIPGTRLIETQLAKRLQVSRTPVREALRQLQQEYLVTVDSTGTLRVAIFSRMDAIQLFGCRMALEQVAVASACESITDEQLAALYSISLQKEQPFLPEPGLSYQFHRLIAKSAGNFWLMALLEQVFDKMVLLRIQTSSYLPGRLRCEHDQIYSAIAHRDPQAAIAAISDHLQESRDRVIQAIEEFQPR